MYAEHYSLSVQQALPWRLTTQVGYVGNQGHHMLDRNNVNLIDPATGRRPLPQFGRVDIKASGSRTNFNGAPAVAAPPAERGIPVRRPVHVVARVRRGFARRRRIAGTAERGVPHCEYGETNQDIRHTLTVNWVYELPFGTDRRHLGGGSAGRICSAAGSCRG